MARTSYYGQGRLKRLYHIQTNMDSNEYKVLRKVASLEGRSLSGVLLKAFEEYVSKNKDLYYNMEGDGHDGRKR